MDWIEYKEWMEFYELEPWGTDVEDDRFAKLINYLLAVNSTEDFAPVPTKQLFPRTEADLKAHSSKEPEADGVDVGMRLHAALAARNDRLAQRESDQQP